jgi:hypothetical protein
VSLTIRTPISCRPLPFAFVLIDTDITMDLRSQCGLYKLFRQRCIHLHPHTLCHQNLESFSPLLSACHSARLTSSSSPTWTKCTRPTRVSSTFSRSSAGSPLRSCSDVREGLMRSCLALLAMGCAHTVSCQLWSFYLFDRAHLHR